MSSLQETQSLWCSIVYIFFQTLVNWKLGSLIKGNLQQEKVSLIPQSIVCVMKYKQFTVSDEPSRRPLTTWYTRDDLTHTSATSINTGTRIVSHVLKTVFTNSRHFISEKELSPTYFIRRFFLLQRLLIPNGTRVFTFGSLRYTFFTLYETDFMLFGSNLMFSQSSSIMPHFVMIL